MATGDTYIKRIDDRYILMREHQILEYLRQRNAPVPAVVVSHVEQGYLEMQDGGMDLEHWIAQCQPTTAEIAKALIDGIQASSVIARLDIWHVDMALRNFVIDLNTREVLIIDFGNALSSLFPLQKPLWMLPTAHQHPLLSSALVEDWASFYERQQLPRPEDWYASFEVPLAAYQNDWARAFAVERFDKKWCVLAHGIGEILQGAFQHLPVLGSELERLIPKLLHRTDEAQALASIEHAIQMLDGIGRLSVAFTSATPRPTLAPAKPATTPTVPPIYSVVSEPTERNPPIAQPSPKRSRLSWFTTVGSVALIAVGWWIMDVIYDTRQYPLSRLAFVLLLIVTSLNVIGILALAASRHKFKWFRALILTHVVAQLVLATELLWLSHSMLITGVSAACVALVSLLLIADQRKGGNL